jgi:hypothetical protein
MKKGRQPIFGALTYVHTPPEFVSIQDNVVELAGGAMVMVSAGRLPSGATIEMGNPLNKTYAIPVGAFRLEAFGQKLDIDAAESNLRSLMLEINTNLEKRILETATKAAAERNVSVERALASPLAAFSLYLVFSYTDASDESEAANP